MLTVLALTVACVPTIGELKLGVQELSVDKTGGDRMVSVTSNASWTVSQLSGADWCVPAVTSGRGNSSVKLSISVNEGETRTAELAFSATGADAVILKVVQAGADDSGSGSGSGSEDLKDAVSPDPASGITVDPAVPNADEPCTIKFNPASGNPLYNHKGELYAHLGVVVEGEWEFVPADWGTTDEKVHFKKVADNSWELELKPSIREYFGTGVTPVNMIAIIVRDAEGNVKSHNDDQFCTVVDNKYKYDEFVAHDVTFEAMPAGLQHGINYNADGSVSFVLYDKDKNGKRYDYCYIVGDWNDWERVAEAAMKRDNGAGCWWITIDGFDPDKEYRFQYRIGTNSGAEIRVSDPYTEIVYDQWNDQYISGVPAFPEGAKALVSAFKINRSTFNWTEFEVEDKNDLVIYEMLFRDFTKSQNIAGALERLDYIQKLGVNAVQLMPIQEFDGNNSWGYNPNHWFALDKYYGTREQYKEFIDECHKRGLAVIVDVVYNHATGQHPWTKMWWNGNATAENNPFFNVTPTHPYNVYHDMNHENALVKDHVKRSLAYLLAEYNVDGFRFDLTKGFTQKDSGGDNGDVAAWGRYDQSRVDILKGYADHIWSINDNAVVIFEHLADGDEEKVLAEHGMQLWRNVNHEYRSAVAGGSGNFSNMYSTAPFGGFVGYMESHDEERLCYGVGQDASEITWGVIGLGNDWDNDKKMTKDGVFFVAKNVTVVEGDRFKIRKAGEWNDAYNYGASVEKYTLEVGKGYAMMNGNSSKDMYVPGAGTYDIYFSYDAETVWLMETGKRPAEPTVTPGETEDPHVVAMRRAGASAAFFLTVPGPKMIWQFGEIGYDYTIEYNGRTGEKPVVTDEYMSDPQRKNLYDTYSTLLKFRRENPRFFDKDAKFEWTPSATVKTIKCSVEGRTFYVVGNFGKTTAEHSLPSGSWNDYFTGSSLSGKVSLRQGEFVLLTNF